MFKGRAQRGDTIIEVTLAFAVFASLAITVTVMMNRSIATAQRSLEITLVRQQIDAQADLLRYARDNELPAWGEIKANLYSGDSGVLTGSLMTCPQHSDGVPANNRAFFMGLDTESGSVTRQPIAPTSFRPAAVSSSVVFGDTSQAQGMWIIPVHAQGSGDSTAVKAYDMYIRTCWNTVGQSVPITLSTIVRLYDT